MHGNRGPDRVLKAFAALAFVLVSAAAPSCMCRRVDAVPAAKLRFIDEAGKPVANVQATLTWWSNPHHQIDRVHQLWGDASGLLDLERKVERETIQPLCMHGVPEHHFLLCIEKPGFRPVQMDLTADDAQPPVDATVKLAAGPGHGVCQDFMKVRHGDGWKLREDIEQAIGGRHAAELTDAP